MIDIPTNFKYFQNNNTLKQRYNVDNKIYINIKSSKLSILLICRNGKIVK